MGNTIAIKLHTEHGQEVICDARAHMLNYELSMMAWFAGCVARPIATDDGILDLGADSRARSARSGPHWAPTGLHRNREHAQHGGRHGLPDRA